MGAGCTELTGWRVSQAAKERLGKLHGANFFLSFDQGGSAGGFWGILDTLPYMRLQNAVMELSRIEGDFATAW